MKKDYPVSYKHALERITNSEIKGIYKKWKIRATILLTVVSVLVIIPSGLYAYTSYANK